MVEKVAERTATLIDELNRLSSEMNLLKTRHSSLSYICTKLSSFNNKGLLLDRPLSNNNKTVTFYESDNTLDINDSFFHSYSATDEVISDIFDDSGPYLSNINIINCNCNEHLSNCFFADENVHTVIPEETLETPFFNLKLKNYIYNEGVEAENEIFRILKTILFVYVLERSDFLEDRRLYFGSHNTQSVFCCPILISVDKTCHYIVIFDQMTIVDIIPTKMTEIKEKSLKNRYFKTSRRSITEELMDEVCQKDEKFNMKTLRQKAAACILYSKVNVLDRHRKASDHIDRFFDSDNKILNKTYRCLECRAIFKLGTELRQHLRTHASPQTVVLS